MKRPLLQKIMLLKGMGVFDAPSALPGQPDFLEYNLIYGFNGSGKTTLSRVFASIGQDALHPELPQAGRFRVQMNDKSCIDQSKSSAGWQQRIFVFNRDFVDVNLNWREGKANPIFYLGANQVNARKELDSAANKMEVLRNDAKQAESEKSAKERAFSQFKTNEARIISERLGLGRRYIAPTLEEDYARFDGSGDKDISKEEEEGHLHLLAQKEPLPKCTPLVTRVPDFVEHLKRTRRILRSSVGMLAIETLDAHKEMLGWVKTGLDYHCREMLSECLFCGSSVTSTRLEQLTAALDDKVDQVLADVESERNFVEDTLKQCAVWKDALPSKNDLGVQYRTEFGSHADHFQASLQDLRSLLEAAHELLDRKRSSPGAPVTDDLLPNTDAGELQQEIAFSITNVNQIVERHNASHDAFASQQQTSGKILKRAYLERSFERYKELEAEVTSAADSLAGKQEEVRKLEEQCKALELQMREHGPAAQQINEMIYGYLGHRELQIQAMEDGYGLYRSGHLVRGALSEGEKTAIALCYFISTLGAEGRKKEDLIVVVDDPISSLDSRALNYAFCMIKGELKDVGQLFVLTHNLHFMNELKKWLKNMTTDRAGQGKAKATLMFIDSRQKPGGGGRSSSLVKMPKFIREYESEYHYLFHLMLRFTESSKEREAYMYLMPNALRKILEIFISFVRPGSAGFGSTIEQLAKETLVDTHRVHALARLVQVESHGDSLDDLTTFSAMTFEETSEAVQAVFELMKATAPDHLEKMSKLCSK